MPINNNTEENKIDIISMLEDFIKVFRKFWFVAIGIIGIVTVSYSGYKYIEYEPYYESQATFSVNAEESPFVGDGSYGSDQVKESLPYILQTNVLKNLVKDELGLSYFPATISLQVKESVNMYILKIVADDAQMADQILTSVLTNISQASVYVLGKINIEILDFINASSNPTNYLDMKKYIVTGLMMGFLICLMAAFIYVFTSKKIKREEDFKKYLSLSCISSIPQITFKKRRKQFDKHIHIYNDKIGHGFLESIRTIRTRVEREAVKLRAQSIMVTSSIPGEGKSTVAVNLALSLAEKGKKVVLVDFDLRNPSVAKVIGKEECVNKGVVDLLKKPKSSDDLIEKIDGWNLSVLYGGKSVSDPSKLLSPVAIKKIIDELKLKYEYVILDTPPSAMLVDASLIAAHADCVIYVVKQDYARMSQIAEGLDVLASSRVPVIGAILNGLEKTIGNYAYGGYRYTRYSNYGHYGAYGAYSKNEENTGEFIEVER